MGRQSHDGHHKWKDFMTMKKIEALCATYNLGQIKDAQAVFTKTLVKSLKYNLKYNNNQVRISRAYF